MPHARSLPLCSEEADLVLGGALYVRTCAGYGGPGSCQVIGRLQSSEIPGEDHVRAVALDVHPGRGIIGLPRDLRLRVHRGHQRNSRHHGEESTHQDRPS
jgi:hypothetical protein